MSINYENFSDIGGIDYQNNPLPGGTGKSIQFNDGSGNFAGNQLANIAIEYNSANILATNMIANEFVGNGTRLYNTVDAPDSVYGGIGNVASINVTNGRITSMSNVIISGSGGVTTLGQLTDVTIDSGSLNTYQAVVWSGTEWINHYPETVTTSTIAEESITNGDVVYVFNGSGTNPRVKKSIATDSNTMPSIGISIDTGNPGDEIHVVTKGIINIQLPGMTVGNTVYVSNTVLGGLMDYKPLGGTDLIQNVGICIKSGNGGKLLVTSVGRTNDIPNTQLAAPGVTTVNGVYVQNNTGDFLRVPSNDIKSFVINHPNRAGRYLVHGCLEGPEAGVYYRGRGNSMYPVRLPDYVPDMIKGEPTIQVTPIGNNQCLGVSEWNGTSNTFRVISDYPTDFYWTFTAMRLSVNTEPLQRDVDVHGEGPYKYIK